MEALGRAVGRKFIFEPTLDACRREYDVRMGWMPILLFIIETLPMEL